MQNNIFVKCICVSVIGGMLVNVRSFLFFSDTQIAQMLIQKGYGSYLMEMGNNFKTVFLPGLAAGFAGLMMMKKIYLWQGCFLCLTLPFFDALFQCIVIPILGFTESYSANLSAITFNYIINYTYSFSIFFIALVFYGICMKDKLLIFLSVLWNIFRYFLLYLIPPLFPQFNLEQLRMDQGELTKRSLAYGLAYTAIILLMFFIICDLKKNRILKIECTNRKNSKEK